MSEWLPLVAVILYVAGAGLTWTYVESQGSKHPHTIAARFAMSALWPLAFLVAMLVALHLERSE